MKFSNIFRSPFLFKKLNRSIMKAIEFQTRIMPDGKIEVPDFFIKKLKCPQVVRVIVLISEPAEVGQEDKTWACLTQEQFLAGYSDADSVYDQLS